MQLRSTLRANVASRDLRMSSFMTHDVCRPLVLTHDMVGVHLIYFCKSLAMTHYVPSCLLMTHDCRRVAAIDS